MYLSRVIIVGSLLTLTACAGNRAHDVAVADTSVLKKANAFTHAPSELSVQARDAIQVLQQRVEKQPQDIGATLALAALYRQLEQFYQAQDYLKRAQALQPNSPLVLNELAIFQRAQGRFEEAEKTYLQVLANNPEFYDGYFNLGVLYDLYMNRPREAHRQYKAYLRNAPEADVRVEKWLVDLQRRYNIEADDAE